MSKINNIKCPFCNESTLILLHDFYMDKNVTTNLPLNNEKVRVKILVCESCGLGFNATPMTSAELDNFYKHYNSAVSYYDETMKEAFKEIYNELPLYKKYIKSYKDKIVEIGCNDGFFLDIMQKDAANNKQKYTNLMGIEPSDEADIGIAHGLKIDKAFFKAGYFQEKVDMFILRQVFEHFENPFTIFQDMVTQLTSNGVIIIESPNLDAFCHIHLFYYSWPFYEIMAKKYGMKIIECKVTRMRKHYNITAVFAKNTSKYTELRCPYTIYSVIYERKKDIQDSLMEYYENTKLLKKFLKSNKTVYWWGCGGTSVSYLETIRDLNILNDCKIIPANLMAKRKGYMLPSCDKPTVLAEDIENTHVDGVVIATMMIDEVKKTMRKYNITYDNCIIIEGVE